MHKINKFILRHKALLLLIALALLLRFPWLYTTMEKDEGSFGYAAWRMLEGEPYKGLVDNKPPLLYMMYTLPIYLFGNSIIPVRILNNILFIISIIFFFKLATEFFSKKGVIFSTLFYAIFMNIPVFEGYLAMSESLLTPFLIISLYLFKRYTHLKNNYLLLGSLASAIFMVFIKQQAIFIYLILISGLFIYKEKNRLKKAFLISSTIAFLILIIFFINNTLLLSLLEKTQRTLFNSPMGFSSGYQPFRYNLMIILEGSLLWLFSIIGIIKTLKTKFDSDTLFILSWLLSAFIFTIMPPAYGHYYLFLIPPLAMFAGVGTEYVIRSRQDKRIFFFTIAVFIILAGFLVIEHYPSSRLSLGPLYWGWSSFENYQQQVLLSERIKSLTSPGDKILLWGWEPGIYWLSERKSAFRSTSLVCESFYPYPDRNITLKQFEKRVYKDNVEAIIFLPGYPRKCAGVTKEVFSDPSPPYSKIKIDGIEGYIKNDYGV